MPKGVYLKTEEHKKKLSRAQLGRHPSLETREKMRQSRLGFRFSAESLEKMRQSKLGRQITLIWRERMRQAHLGQYPSPETLAKLGHKKESHWNWKGGLSNEPYPFEFNEELRERVRDRDSQTCQLCGMGEVECLLKYNAKLDVHHIDYDKGNLNEDDMISLCKSCNSKVNHNREFWFEYFLKRKKQAMEAKSV